MLPKDECGMPEIADDAALKFIPRRIGFRFGAFHLRTKILTVCSRDDKSYG
jgi:hypothetical protein